MLWVVNSIKDTSGAQVSQLQICGPDIEGNCETNTLYKQHTIYTNGVNST